MQWPLQLWVIYRAYWSLPYPTDVRPEFTQHLWVRRLHHPALSTASSSEWVSRVLRPSRHIGLIGHFVDESFQACDHLHWYCTDNSKNRKKYTKNTKWSNCPWLCKTYKTHRKPKTKRLNLNQQSLPSTPVRTVYNCVQLWYTIQHWTALIIFPLIRQTIIRYLQNILQTTSLTIRIMYRQVYSNKNNSPAYIPDLAVLATPQHH